MGFTRITRMCVVIFAWHLKYVTLWLIDLSIKGQSKDRGKAQRHRAA